MVAQNKTPESESAVSLRIQLSSIFLTVSGRPAKPAIQQNNINELGNHRTKLGQLFLDPFMAPIWVVDTINQVSPVQLKPAIMKADARRSVAITVAFIQTLNTRTTAFAAFNLNVSTGRANSLALRQTIFQIVSRIVATPPPTVNRHKLRLHIGRKGWVKALYAN